MGRLIDADVLYAELDDMTVFGETFITAVEFAKRVIQNAQTVGGWISVKDQMPGEDEGAVLAVVKYEAGWCRILAWWNDNIGWVSDDPLFVDGDGEYIAYWCRIPAPPKEVTE